MLKGMRQETSEKDGNLPWEELSLSRRCDRTRVLILTLKYFKVPLF